MELFKVFMKGLWVGGTLTVPGVSGGSMAMILGVYERLIVALNRLFKKGEKKKESILFIGAFSLGGICGIVAVSGAILALMDQYPLSMAFLFAGAVLGGVRVIFHEINRNVLQASDAIYPLAGLAAVLAIAALPSGMVAFENSGPLQWLLHLAIGIVAAGALVLPGISISQLLYVLGMYRWIMGHLSDFEFISLIPFGVGLMAGVVFISRLLEDLLCRFRKESYLVTLGFVVGSVIQLLKSVSFEGFGTHCILLLAIGFIPIFMISKRKKDQG